MNEEIQTAEPTAPEPEIHNKPVLAWLAKSIFIGSVVEFFKGIIHFFSEHIKLLLESFRVAWFPFYKGTRDEMVVLMNRSQAVFGFLLTILGFLIFMVKINVLDEPDKHLSDVYGNETTGILINVIFFLIISAGYFLVQAFFVLLGRLYRLICSPMPNKTAYDMFFISIGNQVFILGALCGLVLRFFFNIATVDADTHGTMVWIGAWIVFFVILSIIMVRLWKQNRISVGRKILYAFVLLIIHSAILATICYALSFFYLGV